MNEPNLSLRGKLLSLVLSNTRKILTPMFQRRSSRPLPSIRGSVRVLLTNLVLTALALAAVVACAGRAAQGIPENSQTHWLETCVTSADCGTLECNCGICTRSCSEANSCAGLGEEAVCAAPGESSACDAPMSQTLCLAGCQGDDDCDGDTTCQEGACIPDAPSAGRADGEACDANEECASGVCESITCFPEDAKCVPVEIACPDNLVIYCGCDGVTFDSSGGSYLACVGRPFAHLGECEADTPKPDGASCSIGTDCDSGLCAGEGCGAEQGTCVARDAPCVALPPTQYCGCDGIAQSSACPTFRWEHEGACEGDTPKPDGATCLTAAECESGVCQGQGCDDASPGLCGGPACDDIAVTYCTCEGETIHKNACAGTRYEHVGECEPGTDPGDTGCDTNTDCASGICEGQGCGAGQGICRAIAEDEVACTDDAVPVCDCDGLTVFTSSTCRGVRYEHEGECEIPGLTETVILPNGDTIDVPPVGYQFETLQGIDTLVGTLRNGEGEAVFQFDACGLFAPAVASENGEPRQAVNTPFVFARSADDSTGIRVTFADRSTNFSFEASFPEDEALQIARTYTAVGEPCIED